MRRLVVISNRLPKLRSTWPSAEPEVPAGGLASAVLGALKDRPGSLWFGWSGMIVDSPPSVRLTRQASQGVELAGLGLTQAEVNAYYFGFCNQVLWPLFHCFQGKVRIRVSQESAYRSVQTRFATALRPLLRPDDLVWVHDYHLLLVGRELRRLGWQGRLGFFLHIPFPPYDLWQLLPDPHDFLAALMDYDVAGFHVPGFLDNYVYACRRELGARWDGSFLAAGDRVQRAGVYPVGIDVGDFSRKDKPRSARWRPAGPSRRQRLILGVDRLDYTKGIPERILAFEDFIKRYPAWRRRAVLVQIASPSRVAVPAYQDQKRRIDSLVGRVNGDLGEPDWVPIRYLYRSYRRSFLARMYRESDVGLVTPLRDGMNLVAKEFVAAQDPDFPGVLVLSRCAGAAQELEEALIVNPYIPSDVADGIERALAMPIDERRARHAALLERVRAGSAGEWSRQFLEALEGSRRAEPASPGGVLDHAAEPRGSGR